MSRIEACIVFRYKWIATIAENGFHKVEIAHHITRSEETHFHRLLFSKAVDLGHNDWTEQERDP